MVCVGIGNNNGGLVVRVDTRCAIYNLEVSLETGETAPVEGRLVGADVGYRHGGRDTAHASG